MRPLLTLAGRVPPRMVAHCLLVELPDRLVLVDTGFGTEDIADARGRMGRAFVTMMRPALDPAEPAAAQVRALGYDVDDVRDVVVTHLDLDHAGGLPDFPDATVHVHATELAAARHPTSLLEKNRYRQEHWAHGPRWQPHRDEGESWLGFEAVTVLSDDVLLVPLHGHTRGHSTVAVRRPSGGWFLHAGDAYFHADEKQTPPSCPSGLAAFQAAMQVDKAARLANQERLRTLHAEHGPGSGADEVVTIFSAHDATELDALAGSSE